MNKEQESMNFVTSCYQTESCVVPISIDKLWSSFKTFQFDKMLTSHVKSVKFISGNPNEVGSVFQVEYKDNSVWENRILEISDKKRTIAWELIETKPDISFTSMLTTIKFFKVTEDNTSFVFWESDFSNDVNSHVIQDSKFKKLDYFKDLKKYKFN